MHQYTIYITDKLDYPSTFWNGSQVLRCKLNKHPCEICDSSKDETWKENIQTSKVYSSWETLKTKKVDLKVCWQMLTNLLLYDCQYRT